MKWRIISDLILAFSFLFLPWWAAVSIGLLATLFWRFYFEFIIACFFIDSVFGGTADFILGIPYFLTLLSVIVFGLSALLRRRLAVYGSS